MTTSGKSPTLTVSTFTNGFSEWRARVDFGHTLSESDARPAFNLDAARRAIVRELAERERKTGESAASAARRVRDALPRLAVLEQHVWPSVNTWRGVTIGEA